MKVVYISDSIIPSRFANSVNVMKMCQAFSENGHEVLLYARKGKGSDEQTFKLYNVNSQLFEIVRFKLPPIKIISSLIYVFIVDADIKKKPSPDIFYSRLSYGLVAISSLGVPMVFESHSLPSKRILKNSEKQLFSKRNFQRLVVISKALKNDYLKVFPWLPEDKIVVAHDGADLPDEDYISDIVISKDNQKINVGYTGHLYLGRGIEIITSLANELPHINFHIVGGMDRDIVKLKNIYKNSNLYFHGFVPHNQINSYLRKFDIVLAPYQKRIYTYNNLEISRWISPLKIFEYMAAGKAIVASNIPVIREVLIDKNNAILVEPDDLRAWKDAILSLCDESKRFKLGQSSKKSFEQKYTWMMRAQRVLE